MSISMELTLGRKQVKVERMFDLLDVAETTRTEYQARIGLFLTFIERNGLHRNSFLDFKRYLAARTDIALSTKQKYLVTARIFLKELNRQGLLPDDFTQNIKVFRQSKKHKRDGLNDDEMRLLSERLRLMPSTPVNARLKAIFGLLALNGLRQIEVVRLDVRDLELARGVAHVHGKGRDDTEPVYLHPEVVVALREYLSLNRIADGALFVSRSNNSQNHRITTKTVRCLVKGVFDELGLQAKTTHGLRHWFSTTLIKEYKGDLLEVMRYTRHKSLETLQVYNDNIAHQADLPRYYKTFEGVLK